MEGERFDERGGKQKTGEGDGRVEPGKVSRGGIDGAGGQMGE